MIVACVVMDMVITVMMRIVTVAKIFQMNLYHFLLSLLHQWSFINTDKLEIIKLHLPLNAVYVYLTNLQKQCCIILH